MHSATQHEARRLSPLVPLGGLALRPLPLFVLRPALTAAMAVMQRRHPDVFDRLDSLGDTDILIDATDLPVCFLLRLGAGGPSLSALRREDGPPQARAVIRGPLAMLIDLLEGRIDGDAVFFSRGLAVEGDMEAVVALRNAVDSAEIDLVDDVMALLGPFAFPARRLRPVADAAAARIARDFDAVRDALTAPLARRCEEQAARLHALENEMTALRDELARSKTPRRAASRKGPRQ
jgi:predicted lipid carrier protein YhbT